MTRINDFYYPSSNGTDNIHARIWTDDGVAPRGVVQIVHGIVEHLGRYDEFARFLASHGFIVAAEDHLGHGLTAASPENYGYFSDSDGWFRIVRDMKTLRDRAAEPGLPYFILGHSMGSFLTRTYLIEYPDDGLAGALISGTAQQPLFTVKAGLALISLLKHGKEGLHRRSDFINGVCFGAYNSKFKPNRTPCDWVCSDEAVVDAKLRDPAANFVPALGGFRDMLHGIEYMERKDNLSKMNKALPVFFFSGDHDPVGDMGRGATAAYQSFLSAGCTDVSFRLYPGGRHEMLNEVNRDEVWLDVLNWIESKMS